MKRRTLKVSTVSVGNVGIGEDDLITYSVPANVLAIDGDYLLFYASGSIANSINAKRLKVKFGAKTILDTGAAGFPVSAAIKWIVEGMVIRTGATTQDVWAKLNTDNATLASYTGVDTAVETLSGAVTLKITGEGVADNDVLQENLTVTGGSNA